MNYLGLPVRAVNVNAHEPQGPCEWWRHTLSDGGINNLPLPERVIMGAKKLQPRLVRVFIQEYFNIYPEHGQFNWSLLDPFMDSVAATGAKIVASINVKPKVLFPVVDHAAWRPNSVTEWQEVIAALVRRYSVEKPYVTYWEIGNETDIGEQGATPFLIPDPDEYLEFYGMTIKPVLEIFPEAKVGGAAACWIDNEPLVGLIERCLRQSIRLDFISWHCYNNNPERHVLGIEKAKARLAGFSPRPEMLYTEWSTNFMSVRDGLDLHHAGKPQYVSVQEMASDPFRAASVAASILRMMEAGLDWSFYYHVWDQCFYPEQFRPFFSDDGLLLMHEHWNEVPHKFGMFGVEGEVRPQYFVYQLLTHLQEQRVAAHSSDSRLYTLATQGEGIFSVMLVNFDLNAKEDFIAQLHLSTPHAGEKMLSVYRVDGNHRWSEETLELEPIERRTTLIMNEYRCQVLMPGNSAALLKLEDK
jgi:xylan 1,4-beta-xylosidase